jgi:DNA-binding MarR family transcriptional regulator
MSTKKVKVPNLPATSSREQLLIEGNDLYLRRTIENLSTLSWLLERIRSSLSESVGVSPFQYKILQTIGRLPSDTGWSVGALARHFRVTNAYVSTEVSALIDLEYLHSTVNVLDRRGKFLELTDQSRC